MLFGCQPDNFLKVKSLLLDRGQPFGCAEPNNPSCVRVRDGKGAKREKMTWEGVSAGPAVGTAPEPAARAPCPWERATLPVRGVLSHLTHQFLGMVPKCPHEVGAAPRTPPLGDTGRGAPAGRAGGSRRGATAIVIVYEAPAAPGAGRSRAEEREGERSREGQRCLPTLEAASPDTRGRDHPGDQEGQGRR